MQNNPQDKFSAMVAGGAMLADIRDEILSKIEPGVKLEELEKIAQDRIKKLGAYPSFQTVDGYRWATCININEGCCHGIPEGRTIRLGDLVTLDIGVYFREYHTDTSATVVAGKPSSSQRRFLQAGKEAVFQAISIVKPGVSVYEISKEMQSRVEKDGYKAVYQLVGHGIGKELHEKPSIPCVANEQDKKVRLEIGQTVAIEIMYAEGDPTLGLDKDGWTYATLDRSATGMFEHTVYLGESGPIVLTMPKHGRERLGLTSDYQTSTEYETKEREVLNTLEITDLF